jgi:WD40 repeat protein/serine/threonine protein kinase
MNHLEYNETNPGGLELSANEPLGLCAVCLLQAGARASIVAGGNDAALSDTLAVTAGQIVAGPDQFVPRFVGDYELLEEIARGGMGIVFKARQVSLKRTVALKMIHGGALASPQAVQRFQTEAEAAAKLDHPHIVPIYEIGQHEGSHYFSMKLLSGRSLAQRSAEFGMRSAQRVASLVAASRESAGDSTTPSAALSRGAATEQSKEQQRRIAMLVSKIAEAVHYAHQHGVLHRDLKPSNIMLDALDEPHVTDFGLAKLLERESSQTLTEAVLGSPGYMAPEQACGKSKQVTTAADTYSLGVVLFELLTGHLPFRGATPLETMRAIVEQEPPHPRALNPLVAPDLETICLKCLEKEPSKRYLNTQDLAEELSRFLSDEPIQARPASRLERTWRWCRRNRVVASLGAVITLLVLAVSIGSPVVAVRIAHQRETLRQNLYAADIKTAQVALEQNNLGQAIGLLKRYARAFGDPTGGDSARPSKADEPLIASQATDLRGIEWGYLWHATKGDEVHLWAHPSMVACARFSPDSKRVASACFDGFLRIWDVSSRKMAMKLGRGIHDSHLNTSFCFSPDGSRLASVHKDGILIIDPENSQIVRRLEVLPREREHLDTQTSLAYSPDGKWLVARLPVGIRVWDTADFQTTLLPIDTMWRRTTFAPHGATLAVVSPANVIELWDIPAGKKVREFTGVSYPRSMAFSPDDEWLAAGNEKGELTLWELRTGQQVWIHQAHRSTVNGLAFSQDGKRLASGALDQLIHVWDVAARQKVKTLRGNLNEVWSLEFSHDDRFLVSASKDATVRLWEVSTERRRKQWWLGAMDVPLGYTTDGRRLITITTNGTFLRHWHQAEVTKSVPLDEPVVVDDLHRVILSRRGTDLFVGETNGTIRIFNAETGQVRRSLQLADGLRHLAVLSPDDRWLAGTSHSERDQSALCVWDSTSGSVAARIPEHEWLNISTRRHRTEPAFSRDGRLLAIGTTNFAIKIWDMVVQRYVQTLLGHSWYVYTFDFSADGKYLASSSWDGDIRIWEVASGKEVVTPLRGHGSGVSAVRFSLDAKTLVTSGWDNTIRFWHVPTGREMLLFNLAARSLQGVPSRASLLSPTGEMLVLWDATRQAVRVERIPTLAEVECEQLGEDLDSRTEDK